MKKIYTFENMIIYSSYIGKNKDLLYCPDNQCFVYVKTEPVKVEILKISHGYEIEISTKSEYTRKKAKFLNNVLKKKLEIAMLVEQLQKLVVIYSTINNIDIYWNGN